MAQSDARKRCSSEKGCLKKVTTILTTNVTSLAKNALCIANNSGGAHLASYLDIPVIGLYSGHEMATEWAPQFCNSYVIHRAAQCSPCHGEHCAYELFCLSDIKVQDVYNKSLELLAPKQSNDSKYKLTNKRISLKNSSDFLVKKLIKSIGSLMSTISPAETLVLAQAIAHNHPANDHVIPGKLNDHRASFIVWKGFSHIEPNFRWTEGYEAKIHFDCPEHTPSTAVVKLFFNTLDKQRITIYFNEIIVFEGIRCGDSIELNFIVYNLLNNSNELVFALPDAHSPGADCRLLGLAFRSLSIITDVNAIEQEIAQ